MYYQGKYLSTAIVNGGVAHCTFPAISGIDTIFVTATKQNYAPASSTSLTVDWALSTQSELFLNQVNIYPNPSTNFVNVESKQAELIEHVTVRDLTGRIVIEETWHKSKGTISLVGLSNALYFIETETTKGKIVSKFIKKN